MAIVYTSVYTHYLQKQEQERQQQRQQLSAPPFLDIPSCSTFRQTDGVQLVDGVIQKPAQMLPGQHVLNAIYLVPLSAWYHLHTVDKLYCFPAPLYPLQCYSGLDSVFCSAHVPMCPMMNECGDSTLSPLFPPFFL